jgi:hypothetical protein
MNKPTQEALNTFRAITPEGQFKTVLELMGGEEGQFFADTVTRLAGVFAAMPKSYETDGQGKAAVAHLHYFCLSCDWWIIEKDADTDGEGQIQAFGIADLGQGCREYGYINLVDVLEAGGELDFHYTPLTAGEILKGGR